MKLTPNASNVFLDSHNVHALYCLARVLFNDLTEDEFFKAYEHFAGSVILGLYDFRQGLSQAVIGLGVPAEGVSQVYTRARIALVPLLEDRARECDVEPRTPQGYDLDSLESLARMYQVSPIWKRQPEVVHMRTAWFVAEGKKYRDFQSSRLDSTSDAI